MFFDGSDVSEVVWSPNGDWLADVQNWSPDTLEGQISLVRPNGDDAHTVTQGDAPDWSPDAKKLVYVHNGSIWTVNADGSHAHLLAAGPLRIAGLPHRAIRLRPWTS